MRMADKTFRVRYLLWVSNEVCWSWVTMWRRYVRIFPIAVCLRERMGSGFGDVTYGAVNNTAW